MIKNREVSVIIPLYNREHTIERALAGALDQQGIVEIIIVDDGSTDNGVELVESLARNDKRIKLVRMEKNGGATAARNRGIKEAVSPCIAFLDSDDQWLPGKIERQLNILEADPALAMVYTGIRVVDSDIQYDEEARVSDEPYRELLRWNYIGTTSSCLIRKTVLDEIGGFDETLKSRQDLDLWLRVARTNKIAAIREPLVRMYIDGADRISRNLDNQIQGAERFLEKHLDELQQYPGALARNYLRLARFYRQTGKRDAAMHYFRSAWKAEKSWKTLKNYMYHLLFLRDKP